MKLLSARDALLLTTFLASLAQLASGAPFPQHTDATKSQTIPHGYCPTIVPADLAHEATVISRDEDDSVPGTAENEGVEGIFARINLPKPPVPPPPPPPRLPIPAPKGSASKPKQGQPAPGSRPITPPRPNPPKPDPGAKPIPLEEKPGQGEGKGNEPKPMEAYEQAGVTQLRRYETTIRSGQPDTFIVQTEADLAKHEKNKAFLDINKNNAYTVEHKLVVLNSEPELKVLKNFRSGELGFDVKSVTGIMELRVTVQNSPGKPINRGTYDKEGRFIIYQDAFKTADEASGAKKTPLNEMGIQNFKNTAGDKTKNLKAVFLMDIQNKEFWAITRQNYNDLKQPFKEVLTFERGTKQFERYMGSPNLNSKFYSFANHHNAIGNKIPDKIIVIPKQNEDSGGKLTAAVIFKDV